MQAPPIDTRGYADLVAETEDLAKELSCWRPAPDGRPDAGAALIRVFGHFAELVVERLNRAPEKSYLAFLNLLGTSMLPPQPARVPLTFTLAANSPLDATVGAGTRVAAPPLEGEGDELPFETERGLVVHRPQLQAVYVSDTTTDTADDRTAQAAGAVDAAFAAFSADQPTPHHLYMACDPLLTQPGTKDVTVLLRSANLWQWSSWPVTWAWWDGTDWQPVAATAAVAAGAWQVTLPGLPQLTPHSVGGIEAGWLRARLELRLPPGGSGTVPESVAVGARNPQDPAVPLAPFPELSSVRRFYVSAEEPFSAAGARARLRVRLARPGQAGGDLQVNWTYQVGDQWLPLGQSTPTAEQAGASGFELRDGTRAFTRDGEVAFNIPMTWPRTLYRTRTGRWLRADITVAAQYTTPPEIASLEVDHDWEPPEVERITVRTAAPGSDTPPSACLAFNDFQYADRTAAAAQGPAFAPFVPTSDTDPAFYLGFDQPFVPRLVALYLQVEPPLPEEVAADRLAELDPAALAHVTWEYAAPDGWRPLGAVDETGELSSRGLVQFVGPADHARRARFGQDLYWLRARWGRGIFPLPPRLRRVLPNTTWAAQTATVQDEILGSGNGNPGQVFTTAQTPVQPGQQVVVRERERPSADEERALAEAEGPGAVTVTVDAAGQPDEVWVRWHAVTDFHGSGPGDRHYTVDALSGEIRFGDGVAGMVPPPGQNNVRVTYRTGGGEHGNRAAGTIVQLTSGVPFVEGVTNHEPSQGGAPREPIERLKARGPRVLRHRDRAITAQDLEDLAAAASPEVARAAAIVPTFNPYNLWLEPQAPPTDEHGEADAGRMGVLVVPNATAARPTPTLGLLRQVRSYLEERCPATADLWVAGPEWIKVTVTATVVPTSLESADAVGDRVRTALDGFLHPLTGGPAGEGWAFGRTPHRSDLFSLVEAVEGVDHARSLEVTLEPETGDVDRRTELRALLRRPLREAGGQPELERDLRRWLDRALVYPGGHDIDVALG
jgi:Baseplate J-like protein